MQKQDPTIACSAAPSNQESKKPYMGMASLNGAALTRRSAAGHETVLTDGSPTPPEDFEFCVLPSGGLALTGEEAAGMCAADEVFSGGKLLPLRLSSATLGDASALLLLRSDSLDGAATAASTSGGFSSRSSSRSASSSGSSCVSRSTSSKSASSDPATVSLGSVSNRSASSSDGTTKPPQRRSLSSSVFYAHPSPSPRLPRRSAASSARRSTGSAPPASWGVIRLGVVGAPEVYPRRTPADCRKVAAARAGSQSARFEQARASTREVVPVDKKLGMGLLGADLVCSCSPDAVAPVGTAEARQRTKKAEDKKRAPKQSGQGTSRRSRILDWLEELSMPRITKNAE